MESEIPRVIDYSKPVNRHKFWFQYVTTPTSDTPGTCLLLHFDSRRYMFGRVGEGTQRACTERGTALTRTRNLFLTGEAKWEHNGGILGLVLTIADAVDNTEDADKKIMGDITIFGGPKIWHTIATARRFIFRTTTPLQICEALVEEWTPSDNADYKDENVRVWALPAQRSTRRLSIPTPTEDSAEDASTIEHEQALRRKTIHDMFDSDWRRDRLYDVAFKDASLPAMIWIRDPNTKALTSLYCTTMQDAPHISPNQTVHIRLPWPAALVSKLPSADNLPGSIAMSYIIKGRPQRGKFLPDKAKTLGVPAGPSYRLLAEGKPVTLQDGRIVMPDEVMESPSPGHGAAVLDIPAVEYLPDLSRKLEQMKQIGVLVDIDAFLWILSPTVYASADFEAFQSAWPGIKHIVSSPEVCSDYLAMQSAARSATRLNQIRPETFAIPRSKSVPDSKAASRDNEAVAQRGMIVRIAPSFNIDTSEVPEDVDFAVVAQDMARKTRELIPQPSACETQNLYDDISITTLGTGSALPSKYRNVSANLLHIPSLGYFLFDAGEGTLGQLRRLYDPTQLEDLLCNLHMIWISHLHADHHLGSMSVLVARKKAVEKRITEGKAVNSKLYVVSEENLADCLQDYGSVEASGAVLLRCFDSKMQNVDGTDVELSQTTLPISKLDTCKVSHCRGSQGIAVTFSNGFKLAYSGDCRPSLKLAEIGRNADMLIHEATFDDDMMGDAVAKKHSMIGEALGVAHVMQAKTVILTHFSQRYQHLPSLSQVRRTDWMKGETNEDDDALPSEAVTTSSATSQSPLKMDNAAALEMAAREMPICVAFDLMTVTMPQIRNMYQYYPAIESMFAHEQLRSEKRRHELHVSGSAHVDAKRAKIGKAPRRKENETNGTSDKKTTQNKAYLGQA